jgi:hypothetical protein
MLSLRGVYVCTNAAADSGQNTHANARKRLRPPSDATLKRQWHRTSMHWTLNACTARKSIGLWYTTQGLATVRQ